VLDASPVATAVPRAGATNPRFPALDGLRGLSAVALVIYHAGIITSFNVLNALGGVTARLNVGVAVFFALSGFLLYRPFVAARRGGGRTVDLPRYYRRRIVRIVPAYWVVLAVILIVPGIIAQNPGLAPLRSGELWRYALFVQVYDADTVAFGLGQAWTLCVEVVFYALLPLLAWAATRAPSVRWEIGGLVMLSAASFAARMITHAAGDILPSVWLAGTFTWLAVGMVLAVLSVEVQCGRWRGAPLALCWGIAGVVFTACAFGGLPRDAAETYTSAQFAGEHFGYAVFTVLLLAPLVVGTPPAWLTRLAGSAMARWLGAASYGVYLWHIIVLFALKANGAEEWSTGNAMLVIAPLAIVGALMLGIASYLIVERPALRVDSRLAARRARAAPAEPVASSSGIAEFAISDQRAPLSRDGPRR
jgi:peptidoglycan/LPS O-acetylase OafA/YrhL